MANKINIFGFSDIHLGHNINKAPNIIKNLFLFINKHMSYLQKSDIVIIPGDIYDRLLSSNSLDYIEIQKFLTKFLKICEELNIIVRTLEGTPSHDMRQMNALYTVIKELNLKVDYKHISDLSIEHIDKLDIDILYIPDEWKPTPEDVYKDVIEEFKKHNLEHVDIVVMHGAFKYQLPEMVEVCHDEELYSKLTYGGPVISGHIHTRSIYKNILVPGSFDRLTFNDEGEDKGGYFITYNKKEHNFIFKFLDNKYAMKFITLDVRNETFKNIVDKIKKLKLKEGNVSLLINKEDKLNENIQDIAELFPNIKFKLKVKKETVKETKLNLTTNSIKNINLDKPTIENYIKDKIEDPNKLKLILEELTNITNDLKSTTK